MKKKLLLNTFTAFLLQIVTIVCNFVLTRLYLKHFNSEINGLIQSITQFLGVVSLCDLGVGQVIQSSLYKPLAENDTYQVNCVFSSGKKFFRRILYILCCYIILLMFVFPFILEGAFDTGYIITLILVMSINSFVQYYFGIVDGLLINADQRNYVNSIFHIIAVFLNLILCAIFMYLGCSIQVVKLVSSLVYIAKPIAIHIYVRKNYVIDKKVSYTGEPISQKWNGIAQHIASYILSSTDIILLTFFSALENVSVYSIYNMITNGINLLIHSFMSGIRSYFGRFWAIQNIQQMKEQFKLFEIGFHSASVFLYSCTGLLIVPFVRVYTADVNDYEYIQPVFAFLLVLSFFFQGIRIPYSILIHVAGKYKQTQNCYIVSAALNLLTSIILVFRFGLVGIALGTAISLLVQVLWMVVYNSKNILHLSLLSFGKICLIDLICVLLSCIMTNVLIPQSLFIPQNFYDWIVLSLLVTLIIAVIVLMMFCLFYGGILKKFFKRKKNNKLAE